MASRFTFCFVGIDVDVFAFLDSEDSESSEEPESGVLATASHEILEGACLDRMFMTGRINKVQFIAQF